MKNIFLICLFLGEGLFASNDGRVSIEVQEFQANYQVNSQEAVTEYQWMVGGGYEDLGLYLKRTVTEDPNQQQTPAHSRFIKSGDGNFIFFKEQ